MTYLMALEYILSEKRMHEKKTFAILFVISSVQNWPL